MTPFRRLYSKRPSTIGPDATHVRAPRERWRCSTAARALPTLQGTDRVAGASTDSLGAPIETRDIIARAARFADTGAPNPGRVVSHVRQVFNGRGQLAREYQELGQEVSSSTPYVEYVWSHVPADGDDGTGHTRLATIRYPSVAGLAAREVELEYAPIWPGASGSRQVDRLAGLLTRVAGASTINTLVRYEHAGNGMLMSSALGDAEVTCDFRSPHDVGLDGYDAYGLVGTG